MVLILHCAVHFRHFNSILTTTLWYRYYYFPILQIQKLRYKDISWLAQNSMASRLQSYGLRSGIWAPESATTVVYGAIIISWGNRITETNNLPKVTQARTNGAGTQTHAAYQPQNLKIQPSCHPAHLSYFGQPFPKPHTLASTSIQISQGHLRKGNAKNRKGRNRLYHLFSLLSSLL